MSVLSVIVPVLAFDAQAQGAEHAAGEAYVRAAPIAVVLLLMPSSIGPEVVFRSNASNDTRFVFAWPFQIPLDRSFRNRITFAPEIALGADNGALWRGRVGYRYGHSFWLAGLGLAFDKESPYISPEVGIRLPPHIDEADLHLGGTLVVRLDVSPSARPDPRCSALIGWTLF